MARVVIPGIPHHVTQRGVRRMETFFDDEDYETYLSLMHEWCLSSGIEVWAYCLMPNHIHLIAVSEDEKSLAHGIGEAHRRYTRYINFKKGWKGYLWQWSTGGSRSTGGSGLAIRHLIVRLTIWQGL